MKRTLLAAAFALLLTGCQDVTHPSGPATPATAVRSEVDNTSDGDATPKITCYPVTGGLKCCTPDWKCFISGE